MMCLAVGAAKGRKLQMGAWMNQSMDIRAIAPHKKDAPKYAKKLAKAELLALR